MTMMMVTLKMVIISIAMFTSQQRPSHLARPNDGQAREEVGTLDPSTGVLRVTGWYSYYTPDGVMHRVDFVADENGYRVESEPSSVEEEFTPNVEAGPIDRTVLLSLVG